MAPHEPASVRISLRRRSSFSEVPQDRPGWWLPVWYLGALVAVVAAAAVQPGLGFAMVVAMVAVWWLAARPVVAGLIMVSVVPVTSGLERGLVVPGLRVSEVLTVGLGALILLTADHQRDSRWTQVDRAITVFAATTFFLGLYTRYRDQVPLSGGEIGIIAGSVQYVIFVRALVLVLRSRRSQIQAMLAALCASVVVSLLALAQRLVPTVDSTLKDITGYSVRTYGGGGSERVTSVFPHVQPLAAYLVVTVLIGVAALAVVRLTAGQRAVAGTAVVLAVLALVQTVAVGAIVGVLVGVAALLAISPSRATNLAILALAVGIVGAVFAPTFADRVSAQSSVTQGTAVAARSSFVPQSVAFRWKVWREQSLPALRAHPMLGIGPTLPDTVAWRSTESMYLTLLFRGGAVLLLTFLGLLAIVAATAVRAMRDTSDTLSAAGRALVVLVPVLAVMMLIQPYLTYGGVSHLFWLLAALAACSSGVAAGGPSSARPSRGLGPRAVLSRSYAPR